MSEPDDTPTRLQQIDQQLDAHNRLANDDAVWLRAEVSRLREEMAPLYNTEQWLKWCDIRVLERAEAAEADVSRLQQENALLRRSLEMLTKQMDGLGIRDDSDWLRG